MIVGSSDVPAEVGAIEGLHHPNGIHPAQHVDVSLAYLGNSCGGQCHEGRAYSLTQETDPEMVCRIGNYLPNR